MSTPEKVFYLAKGKKVQKEGIKGGPVQKRRGKSHEGRSLGGKSPSASSKGGLTNTWKKGDRVTRDKTRETPKKKGKSRRFIEEKEKRPTS